MKGPEAAGGCNQMALPSCTEGLNAAGKGLCHWAQCCKSGDTFQTTGELLHITDASKPCTKVEIKSCGEAKSIKEIKTE